MACSAGLISARSGLGRHGGPKDGQVGVKLGSFCARPDHSSALRLVRHLGVASRGAHPSDFHLLLVSVGLLMGARCRCAWRAKDRPPPSLTCSQNYQRLRLGSGNWLNGPFFAPGRERPPSQDRRFQCRWRLRRARTLSQIRHQVLSSVIFRARFRKSE